MISLIVDLYSRMRPQPVHVRLQACNGSSIITMGNFLCRENAGQLTYFARFAVILMGYPRHHSPGVCWSNPAAAPAIRNCQIPLTYCDTVQAHTMRKIISIQMIFQMLPAETCARGPSAHRSIGLLG